MRVKLKAGHDQRKFIKRIEELSGENVFACYQCGRCSAGCPMASEMDLLPNQVIRLVQMGLSEDVLRSIKKILSGQYDILILDEINNALAVKLVDLPQVLDIIDHKPPLLHLILTGRDAPPEVIAKAHTVTEMREIKHAYRKGIEPQKGIDYLRASFIHERSKNNPFPSLESRVILRRYHSVSFL